VGFGTDRPSGEGWHLFVPKTVTVLRQGYGPGAFRADALAGLTVAIVALPLAMALAIASGAPPEAGLVTAVVAGFLISALGGSRFQIGGPTGAFVVVVFDVIQRHGYDGLVLATAMAGLMLIAAGLMRLGTWIKYIPQPVVTGFTAGIAVIIFSSQIKDFFGLAIAEPPGGAIATWQAVAAAAATVQPATVAVGAGALAAILALRRWAPRAPAFLIAVVGAALLVGLTGLDVETIGSRFGEIGGRIPVPALPDVTVARLTELLPAAFTIAFLAGVESLLSAVVADGLTGRRHRSNCELVAQGVANTASALVGGLPATGAIARTVTNIRSGARSPVAGMLHAVFVLAFLLVAAPLAGFVPLASLAAVLFVVAWNMSEADRFRHLMKAPPGDRAVLLVTFALTVLVDLTVAIEVGVVLAAILFMHRMSQAVAIQGGPALIEGDRDDFERPAGDTYAPAGRADGVAVYEIRGPFFFGVAGLLGETLERAGGAPRALVLDLTEVPLIDATGAAALDALADRCRRHGTPLVLAGAAGRTRAILDRMGLTASPAVRLADSRPEAEALALALARGANRPAAPGLEQAVP